MPIAPTSLVVLKKNPNFTNYRVIPYVRRSIKKYEDNVSVYCISFIIVITKKIIYAPTLILLIYEVLFLLWKSIFVTRFEHVLSPRRTVKLKKWRQDDACTVNRNTQSLYHPASVMLYTMQLKSALYHLPSNLLTFVRES